MSENTKTNLTTAPDEDYIPPTPVAAVGSPSSNLNISMEILNEATHEPMVGSMVFLENQINNGNELAIGTVTQVTTSNQWYGNQSMRGIIKSRGSIPGMSGDVADVRSASLNIQACYKDFNNDGNWKPLGPSLRMSPATGTSIRKLDNQTISKLTAETADKHFLGRMYNSEEIKLPMNIRDFSSDRGAYHAAILGISGSGKTAFASYYLASQMRHQQHGMIIIDPQGQWSSEQGLPFSLQGWAEEMGREVSVKRISEDLKLDKDAPLFGKLLKKTDFLASISKMSEETKDLITDEMVKTLKNYDSWEETPSDKLMRDLIRELLRPQVLKRIYAGKENRERLWGSVVEILGDLPETDYSGEPLYDDDFDFSHSAQLFQDALARFTPIHNLFSPKNPAGKTRASMWATIAQVFDRETFNQPAPLLILDLSTSGGEKWVQEVLAEDEQSRQALEALSVLDRDDIKAEILMQTCRSLKMASESKFKNGKTLNTMVIFDEAWRYAPPPHLASTPEVAELSVDLAGYARDTRKFGIGWTYITQQPKSLNNDIWDQITVRVIGYGITGNDLNSKIGDQLDSTDTLTLYRSFSPPDSRDPNVYPFMLLGPVSPLSFTKAPMFISAYTDFDDFREDNYEWIYAARVQQGLGLAVGPPIKTGKKKPITASVKRTNKKTVEKQKDMLRENASNGGVRNDAGIGLSSTGDEGDAWSKFIEDEPPF